MLRRLITLLGVVAVSFVCSKASAQMGTWIWIGGSDLFQNCNSGCVFPIGVYGTLGMAAATNMPGGRTSAATWTDKNGNLWMFGGLGYDSVGYIANLNDFWEFDVSAKQWSWMAGNSRLPFPDNGQGWPGTYGQRGVPAPGNYPGARQQALTWTDPNGSLWMFGGEGYGTVNNLSGNLFFNDLWMFNSSTREWTWVSGSNTAGTSQSGQPGVYGALGVPDPHNVPGSRMNAAGWIDDKGNLWLFGGSGMDASGYSGDLNDLWEFSPSTGLWTWMGGSATIEPGYGGRYGTLGVPATTNAPGGRQGAVAWTGKDGSFWMFGGEGYDSRNVNSEGFLNDLWRLNPSTREWTWMGGSDTFPCNDVCGRDGVYGTLNIPSALDMPGGRSLANHWVDSTGDFWLFGGFGFSSSGPKSRLADLWKFRPSANEWIWMGGRSAPGLCIGGPLSACDWPGIYGSLGTAAIGNVPGTREMSASWTDPDGNLWLFGGYASDFTNQIGTLNDFWEYRLGTASPVTAAAPVIKPGSGTYAGSQTVTITSPTPNGGIYYTVDGTTPDTSSINYNPSAPPIVSTSESIQAIAVVPNYLNSAVASASYTINILPPTFSLSASPPSVAIQPGQPGKVTLTLTPENGFNAAVGLSCSGLPSGASCSFAPASVSPWLVPLTVTMTITAATQSAATESGPSYLPVRVVVFSFCLLVFRRRPARNLPIIAIALAVSILLSGCGGGRKPVTSNVIVTATSGSLQQTASVSLTVY
jgi:N-acetylneuraminic acid mutarotase